jgi:hypothetical protein
MVMMDAAIIGSRQELSNRLPYPFKVSVLYMPGLSRACRAHRESSGRSQRPAAAPV